MKQFLTSLALLLTFSVSAQTFQVATQIVASPDCKLKFLNKIDSQIYEVNSVDMTWQYLTTTTIKIKDYDNEVTIYKNNMTSPVFANIPTFLDSVQGACIGSGGSGVQSIVAGSNVTVDNTDPQNPIVSASGGSSVDGYVKLSGVEEENPFVGHFLVSPEKMDSLGRYPGIYMPLDSGDYGGGGVSLNAELFEMNGEGGVTAIVPNSIRLGDFTSYSQVIHLLTSSAGDLIYETSDTYQQGFKADRVLRITSPTHFIQKYHLDSAINSGGGDFIPLHITEPTVVDFDTASYLQFGEAGNGFSIEKPVPLAFQGIAKTFTGVDYTNGDYQAIVGKVTGINIPSLGMNNVTLVGTLALLGDISSGDFIANVNGMNVLDGGMEALNISIIFEGNSIASFKKMSIEPDAIFIQNNSFEIEINDEGMLLNDVSNSLTITPSSLLVPTPPASGTYVLKSDNGVISWELE